MPITSGLREHARSPGNLAELPDLNRAIVTQARDEIIEARAVCADAGAVAVRVVQGSGLATAPDPDRPHGIDMDS